MATSNNDQLLSATTREFRGLRVIRKDSLKPQAFDPLEINPGR